MTVQIYAIRDRLIDYFMQPFVGPDDKSVLASVARLINQGEITSDIAQAPHHFEVWKLGEVTEEGNLCPDRQLLADCSSLIRADLRTNRIRGTTTAPNAESGSQTAPDGITGGNGAHHGSLPHPPPSTAGKPSQEDKAAR